ncbi:putative HXXXD-type acyl-transferase family protein [Hibiscus syriacus]|uniref:HXXXD-type acyl-transferase family protein n=1 Tax=Hibiscus syriacus TaxID=106335 RepID=A0A6A3CKL3_HIBSY|nr:putative HXXXD-type acyl-transferase family protein [Hibiscus syriacus]
MTTASAPIFPANTPIPIDLFVSKKHPGLPRGVIGFADSSGNIVYKVNRQCPISSSYGKKDLIFKVQRIVTKLTRTELEVFLVAENQGELTCDFKVISSHFQRSCTIYKGDSIVAQIRNLSHMWDIGFLLMVFCRATRVDIMGCTPILKLAIIGSVLFP